MKPRSIPFLFAATLAALIAPSAAVAAPDGKAVFERNCSACHSVQPPPKSAPPIVPIAMRYRRAFPSKAEGVAHMAAFMKNPSKEASRIDTDAIERFGLMPPMGMLSPAELEAVASWVWEQGSSARRGAGTGAGRGQGGGGNCR